ncbi:MAG TPA: hypothetical protein V6C71_04315 [Coleofasciculaceae cyanobacterium]
MIQCQDTLGRSLLANVLSEDTQINNNFATFLTTEGRVSFTSLTQQSI